jgi:hypothetical protein
VSTNSGEAQDAVSARTKEAWLKDAEVAARALAVGLQVFEAQGPEDFDKAFADMSNAHADALAVQRPRFSTCITNGS